MSRIAPLCAALLLAAAPVSATAQAAPAGDFAALKALFDYDRAAPLDVRVAGRQDLPGGVTLEQITYASPVAGRVTATLAAPAAPGAKASRAGVVFMHWGQGDRSEFAWEAALYARAGAVCLTVDAPWARPEPWTQFGESPRQPGLTRRSYIQNTVDLRRAVDLLLARGDVDAKRIAYVGHSYGATQGGVLAGVEPRIRTFVLMGGLPSLVDTTLRGAARFDEYVALLARAVPREQWQAYRDSIGPLTPALYVGHAAPSSVLMQFGTADSWIPPGAADAFFAAASSPKAIRRYPCSHEFNDPAALADRAEWLGREVGLGPVRPLLQRALEGQAGGARPGR